MSDEEDIQNKTMPPLKAVGLRAIKAALFFYVALVLFPVHFFFINPESYDTSWQYALNYAFDQGLDFGRDVVWTFGPLGFIVLPHPVGLNLEIATAFLVLLWIGMLAGIAVLLLRGRVGLTGLLAFAICLAFGGQPLYRTFNIEYFVCFAALFWLCVYAAGGSRPYYLIAVLLTATMFLIKPTAAVPAAAAILCYSLLEAVFYERGGVASLLYAALGIPILFVVLFLPIGGTLADIVPYLRGTYELTSGYNIAMSIEGPRWELVAIIIVILLYAAFVFIIRGATEKQAPFVLALSFVPCVLVAFKHGFVRQDMHVTIPFTFIPMLIGLVLLFARPSWGRRSIVAYTTAGIIVLLCISAYAQRSNPLIIMSGIRNTFNLKYAIQIKKAKRTFQWLEGESLKANSLDRDIAGITGGEKTSILSIDLFYGKTSGLNFSPPPVLQAYSAYTPYLDGLNSSFLKAPLRAPWFVLLGMKLSIDNRHPVLDTPLTWRSMLRLYEVAAPLKSKTGQAFLLLKRMKNPSPEPEWTPIKSFAGPPDAPIEVPASKAPVIAKIYMELNLKGRLMKFLFRIPETSIILDSTSGDSLKVRVVPDVLESGVPIDSLPFTNYDLVTMLYSGRSPRRVESFQFSGKGLGYYKNIVKVDFYEMVGK